MKYMDIYVIIYLYLYLITHHRRAEGKYGNELESNVEQEKN